MPTKQYQQKFRIFHYSATLLVSALFALAALAEPNYKILNSELEHPWSMAFLPDGNILITERGGKLRLLSADGKILVDKIAGLPAIREHGQGGLLDVALHPQFSQNHWVYFSYAEQTKTGYGTAVARAKLNKNKLEQLEVIFRMQHESAKRYHFGSRLVFDKQGYMFVTLGDRGSRKQAQNTANHAGTIVRLHDDGQIPSDNPFINKKGFLPEIYSYGHRNVQGATLHPTSGQLWTHEHGPQGGDELNTPQAGLNYGWPTITYGRNYGIGTKIGIGTHHPEMEQPVHYWTPSIAPSGMAFVSSECYPSWRGDLLVGSLKFQRLHKLRFEGETLISEEQLIEGIGRIRDVRQAPSGKLYLLTDAESGKLITIAPEQSC